MLKPGIQTTELWVTVLTIIGQLVASLSGDLTPRYAAIGSAVAAAAYAISRGLAKTPVPVVPPTTVAPPPNPPVA